MPAFPASPTPHAYARPTAEHQQSNRASGATDIQEEDDFQQYYFDTASDICESEVDEEVQVEVTGVLRQYVIETAVDRKPTYETSFQAESRAVLALQKPDYRYMTPWGRVTDIRDRANIRRALELTCIDFCQRRGHAVPRDLLANHHNESYMSQYRRIQALFDRIWMGKHRVNLYCLPAWTKGFDKCE